MLTSSDVDQERHRIASTYSVIIFNKIPIMSINHHPLLYLKRSVLFSQLIGKMDTDMCMPHVYCHVYGIYRWIGSNLAFNTAIFTIEHHLLLYV